MAFRLALCMGLLACAPMTKAQVPADIERITTTGSRLSNTFNNTDIVTSTVSEEQLKLTSAQHIEQVLNYVAGAGVQRGNGQEYLPALRSAVLTGAGACGGVLAAEDNIPLRAAGFCNINELFEAHTEMAQRIEVLKGPASALYGSNALHGVINVITPDTTRGNPRLLGYDYGSYGYNRLKLRHGEDWGDTGLGINASVTRDTGYRNEEGVDQEKLNIRYRFDAKDISIMTGLTYTNLDQETAGYITGFKAYESDALSQSNENPEAFRKASALRLWSRVEWQVNEDLALSVTPYLRDQDMDFKMHFLPGTPLEQNSQKGMGVLSQARLTTSPTTFWDVGLDAEYTEGSLVQFQEGPTQGSPFLVETVPAGKHYDYDVDATLYAPFVAFNWQQEAWHLQLSGRFEHMRYDYTNNMLSGRTRDDGSECGNGGCRYSRPPSDTNSFSNFSPKALLSYQLDDNTQLYTTAARGYRAPQATELYRLQRDQQIADLDSVTATNLEIGARGQLDKLDYQVALYSLYKDDVIYRDSDFFNINNGETWSRGIEITLDYTLSPDWQLAFAGSYALHTYEHDQVLNNVNIEGNDLDTAPATQFNTRLGYQLDANTQLNLEWQFVDEYFTDPENLHRYEGHSVLHLRARHLLSPQLTLYGQVNNLLDENYAERADFSGFSGDRYFPSRPRNFMVSVEYQY